jgi:hypothetical protein
MSTAHLGRTAFGTVTGCAGETVTDLGWGERSRDCQEGENKRKYTVGRGALEQFKDQLL